MKITKITFNNLLHNDQQTIEKILYGIELTQTLFSTNGQENGETLFSGTVGIERVAPSGIELNLCNGTDSAYIRTYSMIIKKATKGYITDIRVQPEAFQKLKEWTYEDESRLQFDNDIQRLKFLKPHMKIAARLAGYLDNSDRKFLKKQFEEVIPPEKQGALWVVMNKNGSRYGYNIPTTHAEITYKGDIDTIYAENKVLETFEFLKEFYKNKITPSQDNQKHIDAALNSTIANPKQDGIYVKVSLRELGTKLLYRPVPN